MAECASAATHAAFGRFVRHGVRTVVGTDGYNMHLMGELNAASMRSHGGGHVPPVLVAGGRIVGVADMTRAGAAAIQKIWHFPEARAAFSG